MIHPPYASPAPRILVIDDDEDAIALTRRLLKRVGATETVDWLKEGDTAVAHLRELAAARQPLPMLTILDLKMPVMDGFAVLKAIRSLPELSRSRLLVVVVSTSSLPEDIARALQLGAFCYFEKYPLPEKFAPVYQLAKARLPMTVQPPDACEIALRSIISRVDEAISVFHGSRGPHAPADQEIVAELGNVRRRATERLLTRVSTPARWPFGAGETAGTPARGVKGAVVP